MMDINCSENCIYGNNGKCTLSDINSLTNLSKPSDGCAYYKPKKLNDNFSLKGK